MMLLLCALMAGSSSVWADTKSVEISPDQALNKGGVTPITIACAKGDGTADPAISSSQLRLYQAAKNKTTGNTITFSSEKTITSIVFTFANSMTASNGSFSEGTYDDSSSTWTGSTTSLTLTVTGTTSSTRIYITKMVVYYEDGGAVSDPVAATGVSLDETALTLTVGDEQLLTATVAPSNATNKNVSWSTSNGAVATVENGTVTAVGDGAATITVTTEDGEFTATCAVTVKKAPANTEVWVETALSALTADDVFVIVGNNGNTYALPNDKGSSTPTVVAVTVSAGKLTGTIADNVKWNLASDNDGYIFYPNGSTTTWLYSTNSNDGVRVGTGDAKHFTLSSEGYLTTTETSSQRYMGIYNSKDWRTYTSINTNITGQTFKFYKRAVPMTITDAGYATFSNASEVAIPEGVTAYYAVAKDESTITLKEITGGYIPAEEGVVIAGTAKTYYATKTATSATNISGNLLKPWLEDGEPEYDEYYTLAAGPTFKQSTGGELAGGKAYLVLPESGARILSIEFGETTGISTTMMNNGQMNNEVYNLAGQCVTQPTKGLYIVNGKKVIIK